MITRCNRCLMVDTRPDTWFREGTCAGCWAFDARKTVDWRAREREFAAVARQARGSGRWDCVIGVSGGKDSTMQVVRAKQHGLNVLAVAAAPCLMSDIGHHNLVNIRDLGADLIWVAPRTETRRRLNRLALEQVGDVTWPEHVSIFTAPIRMALEFDVPLVLYGENPQNEYGGPSESQMSARIDRAWLEEFGGLLGLRVSDAGALAGIAEDETLPYQYPEAARLEQAGVRGLFMGHFFPWDSFDSFLIARDHGFRSWPEPVEGQGFRYEKLDNYLHGIHDYFKYLKFGFGRCTDIVAGHVRRLRMKRSEGLAMISRYDGRYPTSYLNRPLAHLLEYLQIKQSHFDAICDDFTNRELFETDTRGALVRRDDGSPQLRGTRDADLIDAD